MQLELCVVCVFYCVAVHEEVLVFVDNEGVVTWVLEVLVRLELTSIVSDSSLEDRKRFPRRELSSTL